VAQRTNAQLDLRVRGACTSLPAQDYAPKCGLSACGQALGAEQERKHPKCAARSSLRGVHITLFDEVTSDGNKPSAGDARLHVVVGELHRDAAVDQVMQEPLPVWQAEELHPVAHLASQDAATTGVSIFSSLVIQSATHLPI